MAWQLDQGMVNGRRRQRSFETRAEAEAAAREARAARERHGQSVAMWSPEEIAEVVWCREQLAGASLMEAVRFFLEHGRGVRERVSVAELVERFIASREDAEVSARYVRQLRVSLRSLAREIGGMDVAAVTAVELGRWRDGAGWAPKTRNNYLGDVRAMFGWAVRQGLAARDPAEGMPKVRERGDGEVGTLTVEECEVLLRGAVERPEVAGFVVLGLFGGLRPAEIGRLEWSAVDMEQGLVIVEGRQAKTRRRRVVDLTANALQWIRAVGGPGEGRVCGRWWDARWRSFRAAMGWQVGEAEGWRGRWPHNALRHTYASMHYALHQDEAKLQAQMGHESAAMLHRHYRALKTRREAERFWRMKPGGCDDA